MDGRPIKAKSPLPSQDVDWEPSQWSRRDMRVGAIRLPQRPPEGVTTALDFFVTRFPRQGREVWRRRFDRGMVFCETGPLAADGSYTPLLEVRYVRELDQEWPVRRDYRIVHQDRDLLVVDKPPFLPVTPAGHYQEHCLLHLLLTDTGLSELSPLHRLDKDTSGLIVLSARRETRAHYQGLLRPPRRHLWETYMAVCEPVGAAMAPPSGRATFADHIQRDPEAYHRQRVCPDLAPNSVCEVHWLETGAGRVLAQLRPATGRKHQLRVQLAHVGWPVVNDRIYGVAPRHDPQDIETPMLLTCAEIRIERFPRPEDDGAPLDGAWVSRFRPRLSGELDV